MRLLIYNIYRKIFANRKLYNINKAIYNLIIKSIGINNFENDNLSGEKHLLNVILKTFNKPIIFDIGGNVGNYSNSIKSLSKNSIIYSFEPHPKTYGILKLNADKYGYNAYNYACGDKESKLQLYDYEDESSGTEHASLYKETFDNLYHKKVISYEVDVITLDKFVLDNKINKINLLKIDTEGNDFNVLLGAKECLHKNIIDIIHFEFNSMNVYCRVFFKDFFDLLINYNLFRLLPKSFIPINNYEPIHCEIFAYQNIVAVNKNLNISNFIK